MKRTHIALFIIALLMTVVLVSSDTVESHSDTTSSTVVNASSKPQTPEPIPTQTPVPMFEDFDADYQNAVTFNSRIVAKDNKIFYTKEGYLYCYDSHNNCKILIDDLNTRIENSNIHLSKGYVYYLKPKTLNRVNIKTMEVEVVLEIGEIADQLHDKRFDEALFRHFLMNDDLIMVDVFVKPIDEWFIQYIACSRVDNFEFVQMDNHQLLCQYDYVYEISLLGETLLFLKGIAGVAFDESVEVLTSDHIGQVKERYIEEAKYFNSKEMSGNQVFLSRWPKSSLALLGSDLETDEDIVHKELNGLFIVPKALNQYLFCYYFDRLQIANDDRGAIIIDTKNNKVYENQEINNIISGDMDYMRLQNTSYYLDGDVLYVLEENMSLVEYDGDVHEPREIICDSYKSPDWYTATGISACECFANESKEINLYRAEVVDGKLHFTQIYKEFD